MRLTTNNKTVTIGGIAIASYIVAACSFFVAGAIGALSTLGTVSAGSAILNGVMIGLAAAIATPICTIGGAFLLGTMGSLVKKKYSGVLIGATIGTISGPFLGYNYAMDKIEHAQEHNVTTSIQSEFKSEADFSLEKQFPQLLAVKKKNALVVS